MAVGSQRVQWNNSFFKYVRVCTEHVFYNRNIFLYSQKSSYLTLPVLIPDEEKKLSWIFTFTLVCGASKGFMKALKAFQKCTGREGLKSYLVLINPFSTNVSFLYPLKTENLRFFYVFRGYRNEILVEKELNYRSIFCY